MISCISSQLTSFVMDNDLVSKFFKRVTRMATSAYPPNRRSKQSACEEDSYSIQM